MTLDRSLAPLRPGMARLAAGAMRDRRGVTTALVAAGGTILIGMAALATEGAGWYLAARNASTAVDLAALAGASAHDRGAPVTDIARDTAARNGFSTAGATVVQVHNPPVSGPNAGNASAVEVTVAQTPTLSLTRMFITTAPVIRARAVAISHTDEEVCLLALNQLELGGNSTTEGRRCAMASGSGGINIYGSARVRAARFVTTGTCSGCSSGDVWTDDTKTARPVQVSNRPQPVTDPFAGLRNWTPAPPACRTSGIGGGTVSITPDQGAICGNLTIGTNDTLNLAPGVYYFNNADLDLRGRISGTGVTLVFTGDADRVGTIRINAEATGSLSGPTTSLIPGHAEAAGLAIYRDWRATNNGHAKEVQLNGGATMTLRGGVYLPTSDVVVNGKGDINSNCLSIVGRNLSFSGAADTEVDVSGCAGYTPYPLLRTVRLVE